MGCDVAFNLWPDENYFEPDTVTLSDKNAHINNKAGSARYVFHYSTIQNQGIDKA